MNDNFCPNCGAKVNKGDSFCTHCGYALNKAQTNSAAQNNTAPVANQSYNQVNTKKANLSGKNKWIAIVIVIILALAGGLYWHHYTNGFAYNAKGHIMKMTAVNNPNGIAIYLISSKDGKFFVKFNDKSLPTNLNTMSTEQYKRNIIDLLLGGEEDESAYQFSKYLTPKYGYKYTNTSGTAYFGGKIAKKGSDKKLNFIMQISLNNIKKVAQNKWTAKATMKMKGSGTDQNGFNKGSVYLTQVR